MASTKGKSEEEALLGAAKSTLTLLQHMTEDISKTNNASTLQGTSANATDPLAVAQTSATLLKAQTTKLSLLVLNKPFTASAIRRIVSDIATRCLPGLMSARELCLAGRYAKVLQDELSSRMRRLFVDTQSFIQEVISRTESVITGGSTSSESDSSRSTLSSTGIVWAACDALVELQQSGLVGVVVWKAQQYREMLEDAIAELKEWSEDVEDDDEDEDGAASDGADSMEDMFSASNKLPADREDLQILVAKSLKKLKLLSTLYQALIKRRLKTIPAESEQEKEREKMERIVDDLLSHLKAIPEIVDELATALYDLDADEAERLLAGACGHGNTAAILVKENWNGAEDEFTVWSAKWTEAIESTNHNTTRPD